MSNMGDSPHSANNYRRSKKGKPQKATDDSSDGLTRGGGKAKVPPPGRALKKNQPMFLAQLSEQSESETEEPPPPARKGGAKAKVPPPGRARKKKQPMFLAQLSEQSESETEEPPPAKKKKSCNNSPRLSGQLSSETTESERGGDSDDDDYDDGKVPTVEKRSFYRGPVWERIQASRNKEILKIRKKQKEMEEDPDYLEEEDEWHENESALELDAEGGKKRYRAKKELDSQCMWKDKDGKVAITKFAYNPERSVDSNDVVQILGAKALSLSNDDIDKVIEWFMQLKVNAGNYMRDRIIEEIIINARKENLGFDRLSDLADAWAQDMTGEEREKMGETLERLQKTGFFSSTKGVGTVGWQQILEKEFMDKNGLVYLEDEANVKKLGCLAKQATRSKNDLRKTMRQKGKLAHGMIFTARRVTVKGTGARYKREATAKTFVRASEKLMTGRKGGAEARKTKKVVMVDPKKVSLFVIKLGSLLLTNLCCIAFFLSLRKRIC
jgi:hypothetical protein